ncbi:MAG: DUF2958 domain-containing protein [Candidatus Dormibacteria bacterium]
MSQALSPTSRTADLEASAFQRRPCYRYLRAADQLPTYAELGDLEFEDILVRVRLFNPTGAGTWHLAAYDPDTRVAWGVAHIHVSEVGSFSMAEIVEFRGGFGLPIEPDLQFEPVSLVAVLAGGSDVTAAQA